MLKKVAKMPIFCIPEKYDLVYIFIYSVGLFSHYLCTHNHRHLNCKTITLYIQGATLVLRKVINIIQYIRFEKLFNTLNFRRYIYVFKNFQFFRHIVSSHLLVLVEYQLFFFKQ